MRGKFLIEQIQSDLADHRLVRVPDDITHTGQLREVFRRTLCVTARHDDLSLGISRSDAANELPDLAVGLFGYRAGIYDDYTCIEWRRRLDRVGFDQLLLNRCPFRLRSPAPEIGDEESLVHAE